MSGPRLALLVVPALLCALAPGCRVAEDGARRAEGDRRQRLAEALSAIERGEVALAEQRLDQAAGGPPHVGLLRAVALARSSPDLADARAFRELEARLSGPVTPEAVTRVEELAKGTGPGAARARAWLSRETPRVVVEAARRACRPDGEGSCHALAAKVALLPEGSAERRDAEALVQAERRRTALARCEVERILVAAAEHGERVVATRLCSTRHEACAAAGPAPEVRVSLEQRLLPLLATVHDPLVVAGLRRRFAFAADEGELDPEPCTMVEDRPP